jgi:DNA helicase-2/ATP-dependent DNA helicase PcrA
VIEGEGRLVAVSEPSATGAYALGERVFHVKFGYGKVSHIEGNKLTVAFEQAGEKKVIDSFLEKT